MPTDLNVVAVFIAVAETSSFRAAAERLGVSLTEAGRRFFERVAPAVAEVGAAMDDAADHHGRPSGLIRLTVSSIAESFIDGSLLSSFVDQHPDIDLDITISDERVDIVEHGFDAGVRLGEVLEQDMIAVAASGDQRQMVGGAPAYVAEFGAPVSPMDLVNHRCIGWRPSPDVVPYRWEFTDKGRDLNVAVRPRITTNDMRLMLRTALAGGGLTFGVEETFKEYLERGELIAMLEEFCPPFPGFFLYFPDRRHLAPKLRTLVEHVRRYRQSQTSRLAWRGPSGRRTSGVGNAPSKRDERVRTPTDC